MTDEKTITQDGFFGERQYTKAEFIARWTSHFQEFYRLEGNAVFEGARSYFGRELERTCGEEFDKIWELQQLRKHPITEENCKP